ncbi:host attachment protein [Acetobacter sp. TBRC 12305]|uniref:Host attachment protein n=1 Tax=Acetobacter garciniae TaxID=2817435 RepID=A0A939HQE1_9PROT|nr:host attachment protein [Acetobacter garciniae]MBO1326017.1 host attachment protein [Acetobacter garciniae]MBX0345239.1 host attachment protein [Acetobacter garciniae]
MTEARDGLIVYVVADGGKARFVHDADGTMRDVQDFDTRSKGEGDATPGKMPAGSTPSDLHKDAFARTVADRMNDLVAHDTAQVAGFVLAAPAPVLHEIRTHLSKPAAAKVITALPKDLTNVPAHDLRGHFDIPATGWVLPG